MRSSNTIPRLEGSSIICCAQLHNIVFVEPSTANNKTFAVKLKSKNTSATSLTIFDCQATFGQANHNMSASYVHLYQTQQVDYFNLNQHLVKIEPYYMQCEALTKIISQSPVGHYICIEAIARFITAPRYPRLFREFTNSSKRERWALAKLSGSSKPYAFLAIMRHADYKTLNLPIHRRRKVDVWKQSRILIVPNITTKPVVVSISVVQITSAKARGCAKLVIPRVDKLI